MGIPVLIIGKSGTGKSTSLRNFKSDEVGIINVLNKPLPFRTDIKPYHCDNYEKIKQVIADSKVKSIIIDDAGYLITNHFMNKHSKANAGNAVYAMYNELADNFFKLIEFCKTVEEDKIIYFIMHEDRNDFGELKPKTIGKLLDEKVCIEGLFTIVLRSVFKDKKYLFLTGREDELDLQKSPIDMFKDLKIDNDLKNVYNSISKHFSTKLSNCNTSYIFFV